MGDRQNLPVALQHRSGSRRPHCMTVNVAADGWAREGASASEREFIDFVSVHGPGLVRLARSLLRDPALAEDVVQDVLATALLKWSRVGGVQNREAYVRRMVINACTSWFRRAARREHSHDPSQLPEWGVSADHAAQHAERDRLLAALRRLPAKQRTVLVLRHYEGMSDDDIAALLKIRAVTVRSNAHRGLATLRTMLAEGGD